MKKKDETKRIEAFLDELAVLEKKYNVIITKADDNGVEVEYLPYWLYRKKILEVLNGGVKSLINKSN